jgi:hypothetical protein
MNLTIEQRLAACQQALDERCKQTQALILESTRLCYTAMQSVARTREHIAASQRPIAISRPYFKMPQDIR